MKTTIMPISACLMFLMYLSIILGLHLSVKTAEKNIPPEEDARIREICEDLPSFAAKSLDRKARSAAANTGLKRIAIIILSILAATSIMMILVPLLPNPYA